MELIDPAPRRPWQGTVLAVLNIISLATGFFVFLLIMAGSGFVEGMVHDSSLSMVMGLGRLIIFMIALPVIMLAVFVTIGLFKGQKWSVIIMMIFTILAILNSFTGRFGVDGGQVLGSLVVNGFVLYCEIAALKDPFYK
jgi:hypothetical protein